MISKSIAALTVLGNLRTRHRNNESAYSCGISLKAVRQLGEASAHLFYTK
jgi:hypothetical protein